MIELVRRFHRGRHPHKSGNQGRCLGKWKQTDRQTGRLPALPLVINVRLIEFGGLSSRHRRVNWTFLSK